MIVSAAICSSTPLLARELSGRAGLLPDLRAACGVAVATLVAAAPDVIVVVGPAEEHVTWDPGGRLDLAAYAPALRRGGQPGAVTTALPLPLSLGIGAMLLDEAGYTGPRALHGVAVAARPADCLRLGRDLAEAGPRAALLAVGDGSARRSVSAPGHLDERAEPFDAAVERAVRDGDLAALAALDPALGTELLAGGRCAWQVLAGALAAAGPLRTEIPYCDAPFGVSYLAATVAGREDVNAQTAAP
jgi:hypothetical protein